MAEHGAIHRTGSFDAADSHLSASPTAGGGGGGGKLKRPSSTGDVYSIQASAAQQEQVYKPEEHKKEVRLGLRHRDSFAVHRVHLKGGPQHAGGAPGSPPNKADMLAAWNKSPGPLPPGSKKRSTSGKGAAGGAGRRGSEEGDDEDDEDEQSAPTALLTEDDLAELEAESANEGGDDSDSHSSSGGSGRQTPPHSPGGSSLGSPSPSSPGRTTNPFRSVAKGVGSFLGLRKGRRQRLAEEAVLAMATRPDDNRIFSVARGSFVNYPGQRRHSIRAVSSFVQKATAANARKTAASPFAISKVPRGTPLFHLKSDGSLWDGMAKSKRLAKLPPKPKPAGSSSSSSAPPPATPPPKASSSFDDDAPAAATTTASGRPLSARSPPPAPPGNPAAARQAAASLVPPSPPARPGVPSTPSSPGSSSSAAAPSTPVSSPPPPPPPPLTSTSPRAPPAPVGTPNANGGKMPDPISTNHHNNTPVPGILKTAAGHTPRGNSARGRGESTSEAKRRIAFADHHGGKLENIKFCDDLHYSENADHSESDWEETGGVDDPTAVDRSNCTIM